MSVRNNIPPSGAGAFFEGDSKNMVFEIEDIADLTGYTAIFAAFYDDDERIRLTSAAGEIELTGSQVLVKFLPAHTRDKSGAYYYELEVTSPDSKVHTVSYGTLDVSPDKAR